MSALEDVIADAAVCCGGHVWDSGADVRASGSFHAGAAVCSPVRRPMPSNGSAPSPPLPAAWFDASVSVVVGGAVVPVRATGGGGPRGAFTG